MPTVKDKMTGKTIAKMPYDSEGEMTAEKMVAENPGYEIKDGAQRMESYQLGGQVPGQAGFGQRPQPVNPGMNPLGINVKSPPVNLLEKGGKVKK